MTPANTPIRMNKISSPAPQLALRLDLIALPIRASARSAGDRLRPDFPADGPRSVSSIGMAGSVVPPGMIIAIGVHFLWSEGPSPHWRQKRRAPVLARTGASDDNDGI